MFHDRNAAALKNSVSPISFPLVGGVTYMYLGGAADRNSESIMRDISVKSHLDAARHEVADLEHKLEIAKVRVETLEMVVGPDGTEKPDSAKSNGFDGVVVKTPVRQLPRSTSTAAPSRAAPGSWKQVFASMIKRGLDQFSYDDVVQAALEVGLDTTKPSVRVRVSKFKDQGVLERVDDGVYKPTRAGKVFFTQE